MKFIKALLCCLLVCALFSCIGCELPDFGGGEDKADATLYRLTIAYSPNVASNPAFKAEDLTAKYAYGVDGDLPRDEGEIEELKKAGATDEDIAKAGVRQNDGSYYFFDQDPMYLSAPTVDGYVFEGFFFQGTNNLAYNPSLTMIDGKMRRPRWNMEDENVTLEARYTALAYVVDYCYGIERGSGPSGLMPAGMHSNPATYDFEAQKDVTLTAPAEVEGYEFKYWYYWPNGSDEKVVCETLPSIYDETYIHPYSYDASGKAEYHLTLFAFYDVASYDVSFTVGEGLGLTVTQLYTPDGDVPVDITKTLTVESGTSLDVWADVSELGLSYEFVGIYVNDSLVTALNRTTVTVTADSVIEVRVKKIQ